MLNTNTTVILAAGLGTRLNSVSGGERTIEILREKSLRA
jgi:choline kinase